MTGKLLLGTTVLLTVLALFACTSASDTRLTGLKSGEFLATTEHTDGDGWAPFVYIVVHEDGTIGKIRFDYFSPASQGLKSADPEYSAAMQYAAGISPEGYTRQLSQSLLESLRLPVDAVSGATISSNWFNSLAMSLIPRMETGDDRPVLLPMSAVYSAHDAPDEDGWTGVIQIQLTGRTIDRVTFDETTSDSQGNIIASKVEDPAYTLTWDSPHNRTMSELYEGLGAQLINEGRPSGVDVVSGATQSSQRFRNLATDALAKRAVVDFVLLEELLKN